MLLYFEFPPFSLEDLLAGGLMLFQGLSLELSSAALALVEVFVLGVFGINFQIYVFGDVLLADHFGLDIFSAVHRVCNLMSELLLLFFFLLLLEEVHLEGLLFLLKLRGEFIGKISCSLFIFIFGKQIEPAPNLIVVVKVLRFRGASEGLDFGGQRTLGLRLVGVPGLELIPAALLPWELLN